MIDKLHPLEVDVLRSVEADQSFDVDQVAQATAMDTAKIRQGISWLLEKGLVLIKSKGIQTQFVANDICIEYQQKGLPEQQVLNCIVEKQPLSIQSLTEELSLEHSVVGSAIGRLTKSAVISTDENKQFVAVSKSVPEHTTVLSSLIDRALKSPLNQQELSNAEQEIIKSVSKKRGASGSLFRTVERSITVYQITDKGIDVKHEIDEGGESAKTILELTSQHLKDGTWKDRQFRKYNINIPPSRVLLGRPSSYAQFIRDVKDKFVSLGFEEFDGPLIETEFWNCDALYMPQFHPARDTHDVYYVKDNRYASDLPAELVDSVALTHESGGSSNSTGWQYQFDRQFTKRLILRSQGTALSAKQLPQANNPGKYFGIVRCFRNDQIDATHLSDFYQTEGIVVGDDVNLCTLLGLLELFAKEIASAEDIKFVPAYFPFTEPSIEVHIKHPRIGWFELGGSGIFRPEVTIPLGIDVPVLAWGLGIDRMALITLGIDDLRDLFSTDVDKIRLQV